jgi:regulator of RNase E activity RraA
MVDDDGAVVIPQKLAAGVAEVAAEQERMEEWIMTQVNGGASLPGLYPPNAENKARYEAWSKRR